MLLACTNSRFRMNNFALNCVACITNNLVCCIRASNSLIFFIRDFKYFLSIFFYIKIQILQSFCIATSL